MLEQLVLILGGICGRDFVSRSLTVPSPHASWAALRRNIARGIRWLGKFRTLATLCWVTDALRLEEKEARPLVWRLARSCSGWQWLLTQAVYQCGDCDLWVFDIATLKAFYLRHTTELPSCSKLK